MRPSPSWPRPPEPAMTTMETMRRAGELAVDAGADIGSATPIAPPLEIDSADAQAWGRCADVVVVGWGAAGACAAIEARAAGASVLVLDRFGGGGASALSGGVVYAGGGTPQQSEAGFADTPDAMFDYLQREVEGVVSDATLRRFCDESVANLEWLERQGARFGATMPEHKTSYPPEGVFLYYSGNETVPACAGSAPPAPRGHRTVGRGQSGAALYAALQAATLRAGADTITQAAVRRLVRERASGRIVGVELWQLPPGEPATLRHARLQQRIARWRMLSPALCQRWQAQAAQIERAHARPLLVRAARGVVLATGGFIFNPQLMACHAPQARGGWPIGTAGCDGSGLRLGQGVGAQSGALQRVSAWRFLSPPSPWPRGMVVNRAGERFCNEEVYGARLGHEIVQHQGGRAWLVFDARLRGQALRECLFGGLWAFQSVPALVAMLMSARRAPDIDTLAQCIGADPATLRRHWTDYNAAAHGRQDDTFGKSPGMRQALERAPFYAIDISIGNPRLPMAVLTLGGLAVDEASGQVRGGGDECIAGLYAAGRAAIGLPSSHYVSGLSLADCVFSGRRAGLHAARSS